MKKYIVLLILLGWVTNSTSQDLGDYILRSSANLENGDLSKARSLCVEALSDDDDYRLYLVLAETQQRMGLSD